MVYIHRKKKVWFSCHALESSEDENQSQRNDKAFDQVFLLLAFIFDFIFLQIIIIQISLYQIKVFRIGFLPMRLSKSSSRFKTPDCVYRGERVSFCKEITAAGAMRACWFSFIARASLEIGWL